MVVIMDRSDPIERIEFVPDLLFMAAATSGTSIMTVLLVLRNPKAHVGPSLLVLVAANIAIFVFAGIVYGAAVSGAGNGTVLPLSVAILFGSLATSVSAHIGLAIAALDWPPSVHGMVRS